MLAIARFEGVLAIVETEKELHEVGTVKRGRRRLPANSKSKVFESTLVGVSSKGLDLRGPNDFEMVGLSEGEPIGLSAYKWTHMDSTPKGSPTHHANMHNDLLHPSKPKFQLKKVPEEKHLSPKT